MKILSASLFALLAWVSASQSTCPTSHVKVWGSETYPTTPTFDHPYAKYDLLAGTIYSHTLTGWYSSSITVVEANDDYWLEGPASADPISFSAVLHVTGIAMSGEMKRPFACTSSGASGSLQSGAASQSGGGGASGCGNNAFDKTITLALQKLPGEVFPLTMSATAVANGDESTINGVLTFSLPAGYAIRSCHGYASIPTPALNQSWGQLKAAYR